MVRTKTTALATAPRPGTLPSLAAVGLIRVSRVGKREGETFASPRDQREAIQKWCAAHNCTLVAVYEELNVSGGSNLARRDGLRQAVEMIEAGGAQRLVGAYFDRLFRGLRTQADVLERVEAAGGKVVSLDFGTIGGATAAEELQANLVGAFAQWQRKTTAERTLSAKQRAVARGVPPYPHIPPGYLKDPETGRLQPDPVLAPVMARAFEMRLEGTGWQDIRAFLRGHGVRRSLFAVMGLLQSRVYLGQLHFGKLSNLQAHEPIIDHRVWQRVQRMRGTAPGRRSGEPRLLARLGIVCCGSCGGPMQVGSQRKRGKTFADYRCRNRYAGTCVQQANVSAILLEQKVVARVREELIGQRYELQRTHNLPAAEAELRRRQVRLENLIDMLEGLEDHIATRAKLLEARTAVDEQTIVVERLHAASGPLAKAVRKPWHELSFVIQREVVRTLVEQVTVKPGRDDDRVEIWIRGQDLASGFLKDAANF